MTPIRLFFYFLLCCHFWLLVWAIDYALGDAAACVGLMFFCLGGIIRGFLERR